MREIKFRGKRLDGQGWTEGYYFKTPLTADFNVDPEHGAFFAADGKERHCIANQDGCVFEIDPITIGQFTGLHDKDGKDIWEGDIVKWDMHYEGHDYENEEDDNRVVAQVDFSIIDGMWVYNSEKEDIEDGLDQEQAEESVIIGNFHDNPELLKTKE